VESFFRVRASDVRLAWREGSSLVRRGLGWVLVATRNGRRA
jgi:hypothetical protein